jgi:hypothetical protein
MAALSSRRALAPDDLPSRLSQMPLVGTLLLIDNSLWIHGERPPGHPFPEEASVRRSILVFLILGLSVPLGCSDDQSTKPSGNESRFLAGGGRQADSDPFAGGAEGSGPGRPDFDPPNPGYMPLFYSDVDCQENPSQRVIADRNDWQAWWTAAIDCLDRGDVPPRPVSPPDGGVSADSGTVVPDTLIDPYPAEAPDVDFTSNVVLTISLPPDSLWGRSVWIGDVTGDPSGTTVRYTVSNLGEDCLGGIMMPILPVASPTIAVMVPGPLAEPITWQGEEIVYDCSWEPDPSEPLTLYYTDAVCNLGSTETIIRDATCWDEWVRTALECDQARWYDPDSLIFPDGTTARDSIPGDPPGLPPNLPPTWIGTEVDFTTHAVIILRADPQDRWGGGIWISRIATSPAGTTIDYVVMTPGEDCPVIDGGGTIQPTAAIRVPLPLREPVRWNRKDETINCDWTVGPDEGTRPPG